MSKPGHRSVGSSVRSDGAAGRRLRLRVCTKKELMHKKEIHNLPTKGAAGMLIHTGKRPGSSAASSTAHRAVSTARKAPAAYEQSNIQTKGHEALKRKNVSERYTSWFVTPSAGAVLTAAQLCHFTYQPQCTSCWRMTGLHPIRSPTL